MTWSLEWVISSFVRYRPPFRGFMLNKRDFLSKILMFSVQTRSSISVFNLEALRDIYLKARSPGELFLVCQLQAHLCG